MSKPQSSPNPAPVPRIIDRKVVPARLTDSELDLLDRYRARRGGCSRSSVARQALLDLLASEAVQP